MTKKRERSSRSTKSRSATPDENGKQSKRSIKKSPKTLADRKSSDNPKPSKRSRPNFTLTENASVIETSLTNRVSRNELLVTVPVQNSVFLNDSEELLKVTLPRSKLKRWCLLPFFNSTVTGCFVRVGSGTFNNRPIYRIAEIIYVVEADDIHRNKAVYLRHGLEERVFDLEFVSNSDFTDLEFKKWKQKLSEEKLLLPTINHIEIKTKELQDLDNHYKQNEIAVVSNLYTKNHNLNNVSKSNILQENCVSSAPTSKIVSTSVNTNLNGKASDDFCKNLTTCNDFEIVNTLIDDNICNIDVYEGIDEVESNKTLEKEEDIWNLSLYPVADRCIVLESETALTDIESGSKSPNDKENIGAEILTNMIYLSKLILTAN